MQWAVCKPSYFNIIFEEMIQWHCSVHVLLLFMLFKWIWWMLYVYIFALHMHTKLQWSLVCFCVQLDILQMWYYLQKNDQMYSYVKLQKKSAGLTVHFGGWSSSPNSKLTDVRDNQTLLSITLILIYVTSKHSL